MVQTYLPFAYLPSDSNHGAMSLVVLQDGLSFRLNEALFHDPQHQYKKHLIVEIHSCRLVK